MRTKWKHGRNLLILAVVLNCPAILIWIPGIRIFVFIPFLYWINIPGQHLESWIGPPHYDVQEFGVLPQTPLAWILIVSFWTLVAAALAVLAAYLPEPRWRFSVRTLLIAMAVVAILLGLAVYIGR